jgi:hypothetical protein
MKMIRALLLASTVVAFSAHAASAQATEVTCKDGAKSKAGRGACSGHGGVVTAAAKAPVKAEAKIEKTATKAEAKIDKTAKKADAKVEKTAAKAEAKVEKTAAADTKAEKKASKAHKAKAKA